MFIKYQNERLRVTSITEYTDEGLTTNGKYLIKVRFGMKSRLFYSDVEGDHIAFLQALDSILEVEKKFIQLNTIRIKGTTVSKYTVTENPTTNSFNIKLVTNSGNYTYKAKTRHELDGVINYLDTFFKVVN